jgi:hypothetical protein
MHARPILSGGVFLRSLKEQPVTGPGRDSRTNQETPGARAPGIAVVGALMFAVGALALFAAVYLNQGAALADPDPPGNDGVCSHANSDQPCRPDPQPDHGKDCEAHASNFDGNEDHCATQVPTSQPTQVNTQVATAIPTSQPTEVPTTPPTGVPTTVPTSQPTESPTTAPTSEPTEVPTESPTTAPTTEPTGVPTEAPTESPGIVITVVPATEAVASVGAPPAAPVEQQAAPAAVLEAAPPQQAVAGVAPAQALPATGDGTAAGSGSSGLLWASLALLATGGGLLLLAWRTRQI